MKSPQVRFRLDFSDSASLGPGKVQLLEAIDAEGSLSAAARRAGLSYRRAWLLLHDVNESFGQPVVALTVGGRDGGGTRLTPFGRDLIARYHQLQLETEQLAARLFADFTTIKSAVSPAPAGRRSIKRPLGLARH